MLEKLDRTKSSVTFVGDMEAFGMAVARVRAYVAAIPAASVGRGSTAD